MKKLSFTTKIIVITVISLIFSALIMNYSNADDTTIEIDDQTDLCKPNSDLYCWVVGSNIYSGTYEEIEHYNINTAKSDETKKLLTAYILATTDEAEKAYILEEAEKQYSDGKKIGNFYLDDKNKSGVWKTDADGNEIGGTYVEFNNEFSNKLGKNKAITKKDGGNFKYGRYLLLSIKQTALWRLKGTVSTRIPWKNINDDIKRGSGYLIDGSDICYQTNKVEYLVKAMENLVNDAKKFRNYINSDREKITIKTETNEIKVKKKNDEYNLTINENGTSDNKYGPYRIVGAPKVKGCSCYIQININSNIKLLKEDGTPWERCMETVYLIESEEKFYIEVKNEDKNEDKSNKIYCHIPLIDLEANFGIYAHGKLEQSQQVIKGDGSFSTIYKELILTIKKNITYPDITIKKVDEDNNILEGAKFKVEISGDGETYSSLISDLEIGSKYANFTEYKDKIIADKFFIRMSETEPPNGFEKLDKKIVLKFEKDDKNNKWTCTLVENNDMFNLVEENGSITLTIKNKRVNNNPKLNIKKTDMNGNDLKGAKFKVEISGDGETYSSLISDLVIGEQSANFTEYKDADKFFIRMSETEPPNGFEKLDKKIVLKFEKDDENNKWTCTLVEDNDMFNLVEENGSITLRIKNTLLSIINPKLYIKKTDMLGTGLQGAKFKINIKFSDNEYIMEDVDTDNNAGIKINFGEIYRNMFNKDISKDTEIKTTITETTIPAGYKDVIGPICLKTTYMDSNRAWITKIDQSTDKSKLSNVNNYDFNGDGIMNYIDYENLVRYDFDGDGIPNGDPSEKIKMYGDINNDGVIGNGADRLTLLQWLYGTTKEDIEGDLDGTARGDFLVIPNEKDTLLPTIKLIKEDENGNNLNGAIFTGEISKNNESYTKPQYFFINEGSLNIDLNNYSSTLKELGIDNEFYIKVKEVAAPGGYIKLEEEIIVKFTKNDEGWSATILENPNSDLLLLSIDITNNTIILTVKNKEEENLITLGGTVWLDGQTGLKVAREANGFIDANEERIEDIEVFCYIKGEEDYIYTTKTNENGYYEFTDIPERTDYNIEFRYDGVNYQATKTSKTDTIGNKIITRPTDSKADENGENRAIFNNKFETITGDASKINTKTEVVGKSSRGVGLEYTRTTQGGTKEVPWKTILKTKEKSASTSADGNTIEKFSMTASTANVGEAGNYYLSQSQLNAGVKECLNINFGLVKRGVDLSLFTSVASIKKTINGQEEKTEYDTKERNEEKAYLNIPESDYNYRMRDYESKIKNNAGATPTLGDGKTTGDELEVYITYQIKINNESATLAKVNEVVDYFDNNLILKSAKYEVSNEIEGNPTIIENLMPHISEQGTKQINGKTYNEIRISNLNSNMLIDGASNIITLEFKADKDENGNIKIVGKEILNIAEITSYSTYLESGKPAGMIDCDSAPDDALVNGIIYKEDDTDDAVVVQSGLIGEGRTISGYVWDDDNKNGKWENNIVNPQEIDKTVNDVIVQLIEVRPFETEGTAWLEYIWQETKTGSTEIKQMSINANETTIYNNETINPGEYKFTGFIPGNYIIRFIYGDGTTYDLTNNVLKYNGQDYKSTIITESQQVGFWPNSKAKDNEARRLETMAYTADIDLEKGILLSLLDVEDKENIYDYYSKLNEVEKKAIESKIANNYGDGIGEITVNNENLKRLLADITLKNTWMCSETNNFTVPEDPKYNNNGLNLGLAKRPETKLTLVKHVTGLKITPNTISDPLINVTVKNDDILKWRAGEPTNNLMNGQGYRDNTLIINIADRERTNTWQFETDISELMQGAKLEATYTYTVKNEGEEDFVSSALNDKFNEYINNNEYSYSQFLSDKANEVKENIKFGKQYTSNYEYTNGDTWLGKYYYTGEQVGVPVGTIVSNIEETVNPNMNYEEIKNVDTGFIKDITKGITNKKVYDTDGISSTKEINTTIKTKSPTNVLTIGDSDTKQVILSTTMASDIEKNFTYDSYIAQIMAYSNVVGRRDTESIPGNLDYVHSDDTRITMESHNEQDESWAEQIIVRQSTGEDKSLAVQDIIIITVSGIAILAIGIILIKKYAIK